MRSIPSPWVAAVVLLAAAALSAGDAKSEDPQAAALQADLTNKWVDAAQASAKSKASTREMNQAYAELQRKRKELTDAKAFVPPPGASTKEREERIAALQREVRTHETAVTEHTLAATEAEKEQRRRFDAVLQTLRDHPNLRVPARLDLPDSPKLPDQAKVKLDQLQLQADQLGTAEDEQRLLRWKQKLAQRKRDLDVRIKRFNEKPDDENEFQYLRGTKAALNDEIGRFNMQFSELTTRKQTLDAKLKAGRVPVPRTLEEVDLEGRIRAVGGSSPPEAGEFFGWGTARVTKTAADFTREQLLGKGWTKDRLLDVAEGYEHIARITPQNPSATGRATQLREIAKVFE